MFLTAYISHECALPYNLNHDFLDSDICDLTPCRSIRKFILCDTSAILLAFSRNWSWSILMENRCCGYSVIDEQIMTIVRNRDPISDNKLVDCIRSYDRAFLWPFLCSRDVPSHKPRPHPSLSDLGRQIGRRRLWILFKNQYSVHYIWSKEHMYPETQGIIFY